MTDSIFARIDSIQSSTAPKKTERGNNDNNADKNRGGPLIQSQYYMLREKRGENFLVLFARPNDSIWDHEILKNFQELFWSVRVD